MATLRLTRLIWPAFWFSLLLLPFLLLFYIATSISSPTPTANNPLSFDTKTAAHFKRVSKQLQYGFSQGGTRTLIVTEQDINAVFAVANRGFKKLTGQAKLSQTGLTLYLSIATPNNPFGQFINIETTILPSTNQLNLDKLNIGLIELPGQTALQVGESVLNIILGDRQGSEIIHSIQAVTFQRNYLQIRYQPIHHIGDKINALLRRSQTIGGTQSLTADTGKVQRYYSYLCDNLSRRPARSLAPILAELFEQAKQHGAVSNTPAAENRAAIMAMAILLGSKQFNTLLNAIPKEELNRCQRNAPTTLLAKRHDLSQHFIFSAAIKVIADSHLSFAAGELKELQDSLFGGSGFSFVDLAADQAGIHFAELATNEETAFYLQSRAGTLRDESNFFPGIHNLPEGIRQQTFEQDNGGLTGEFYEQKLAEIINRIRARPLYQLD